jgi:MOSC domain-containing protein YiiM
MHGTVLEINVAPVEEAPCEPVDRVRVVAGRGIEGDRKFAGNGRAEPGDDLTLIAAEALEGLEADTGIVLSAAESRRNLLTRGIDLNALLGRRFTVGGVPCEGMKLCEPCNHLAKMTQPGVLRGLVHRGGLRANVLADGEIAVGDAVRAE